MIDWYVASEPHNVSKGCLELVQRSTIAFWSMNMVHNHIKQHSLLLSKEEYFVPEKLVIYSFWIGENRISNKNNTCQTSWSECSWRGSRFCLIVPSNKVGSWGMILRRLRRSWRPSVEISILSIRILPPAGSISRNKAWIKVDLPLPVRPTIPIFFPPGKVQVTPWSTTGRLSL